MHARDAIWGFELTHRAEEIAARLPNAPKLKFVPGPLPEATPAVPAEAALPVPEPTPEQAEQAARLTAGIEDEELRALVARAARASLARGLAEPPDDRSF